MYDEYCNMFPIRVQFKANDNLEDVPLETSREIALLRLSASQIRLPPHLIALVLSVFKKRFWKEVAPITSEIILTK